MFKQKPLSKVKFAPKQQFLLADCVSREK